MISRPTIECAGARNLFTLLIFTLFCATASAQCEDISASKDAIQFQARLNHALDCYGLAKDPDPLITEINAAKKALAEKEPFTNDQAAKFLTALRQQYESKVWSTAPKGSPTALFAEQVLLRFERLIDSTGSISPGPVARTNQWSLNREEGNAWGYLDVPKGFTPDMKRIPISDIYQPACKAGYQTASCKAAIKDTTESIRAINGVRDVLLKHTAELTYAWEQEVALNNKKWNSFYEDALPQYLWEAWWTAKSFQADSGLAPRLRPPPNYQMILLHFDVAAEFVGSGAPDGEHFKPAILLEGLGKNWIKKWDEKTGKVKRAFGLSAGALYADRSGVTDVGAAITAHINNKYNFGLSYHEKNDWGLYVNIPLSEKLSESAEDIGKRYDKVRGAIE